MSILARRRLRNLVAVVFAIVTVSSAVPVAGASRTKGTRAADAALDAALERIVNSSGGPPSVVVVVQRRDDTIVHAEGAADVATGVAPTIDDHMRLASVAKAFSGAVALSTVADGKLSLADTIGARLPELPGAWSKVTLRELLAHTSGIPDFSKSKAFRPAFTASLLVPPSPVDLLSYVADEPLAYRPGSKYHYSNSDNIIVGLMVEQATGRTYDEELASRVDGPLGLTQTTLPNGATMPTPYIHGYVIAPPDAPEDVSEFFAAGWTWTSGGIVTTPRDANAFIRGYAAGATTNPATRTAQFRFRSGSSEPPGPGTNSAGLAIFRYETRCGTVYGHTGNTAGYTQFVAATRDGSRSVTVSTNAQITPTSDAKTFVKLRKIFGLAVCAALSNT